MTTTTIQTTDITAFTFAADNDALWLAPGTIIANGTGFAIDGSGYTGLGLFIEGEVFAGASAVSMYGGTASIVIGKTGSIDCNVGVSSAAMFLQGGGTSLLNDGEIHAPGAVGIVVDGGNNDIHNRGAIYGESDGVFLGLGGGTGDVLINEGTIAAGNSTATLTIARFNHGVMTESDDTQIINYGTITASHATGAGVNIGSSLYGGDGSRLENHGTITSAQFWGVDLGNLAASMKAEVFNDGLISGGTGGIRGNANDDHIVNRGTINGDVALGAGNDTYDGRHGELNSAVYGGLGNDTYIVDNPDITLVENASRGHRPGEGRIELCAGRQLREPHPHRRRRQPRHRQRSRQHHHRQYRRQCPARA